ncbi:hypothetical protein EVAR_23668_1 [Eumeta japonica]|uniref:Uncharacterized protein n=1 Tax=Eumeta variegata TaxID=151549 RepID=A0A4C1VJ88_EUMVA|nr:hypothetical protein EVAR_23668_1 [Eumeta japonica]
MVSRVNLQAHLELFTISLWVIMYLLVRSKNKGSGGRVAVSERTYAYPSIQRSKSAGKVLMTCDIFLNRDDVVYIQNRSRGRISYQRDSIAHTGFVGDTKSGGGGAASGAIHATKRLERESMSEGRWGEGEKERERMKERVRESEVAESRMEGSIKLAFFLRDGFYQLTFPAIRVMSFIK